MAAKVIGVVAIIGFYTFCLWVVVWKFPGGDISAVGFLEHLSLYVLMIGFQAGLGLLAYHTIKWAIR